jgi:hypothetical protein
MKLISLLCAILMSINYSHNSCAWGFTAINNTNIPVIVRLETTGGCDMWTPDPIANEYPYQSSYQEYTRGGCNQERIKNITISQGALRYDLKTFLVDTTDDFQVVITGWNYDMAQQKNIVKYDLILTTRSGINAKKSYTAFARS